MQFESLITSSANIGRKLQSAMTSKKHLKNLFNVDTSAMSSIT